MNWVRTAYLDWYRIWYDSWCIIWMVILTRAILRVRIWTLNAVGSFYIKLFSGKWWGRSRHHNSNSNSKQFFQFREENIDPSTTLTLECNENDDVNNLIPNSFLLLFTAHEFLGYRQWCTKDNGGELLQYTLDAVVPNIKAPVYDVCRDVIYEYLEQVGGGHLEMSSPQEYWRTSKLLLF